MGNASETGMMEETDRLLLLHRSLSECMGGILPAALDLSRVKSVLDVECGAGGWAYDLAWRYPSLYVTGTESHAYLAEEAQALARRTGNAEVVEQDLHALSEQIIPLASFDMVHARFLVSRLTPQEYPAVLASLARRCRKGGLLVWEEPEFPLTSSPACEGLFRLAQDALQAVGRAFAPGNKLGITAMMSHWLKEAGCRMMLDMAYAIDVSSGMKGHDAFLELMQMLSRQIRPFLLRAGVTTAAEFEALCAQAQQEMAETGFCGLVYVRTMAGVAEREYS
jgi:trans-aconitate methyltransferase